MAKPIKAVVRKDEERNTVLMHVYERDGAPTRTYEFDPGSWSLLIATKVVDGEVWV